MGKTVSRVLPVFAAILVVFILSEPHAEIVSHYGLEVESEDTSSGCLSCHDGSVGSYVGSCIVECTSDDSHPVEKVYPPPGKVAKYATIESVLAAGIKLSDNKIGCISCHDISGQAESLLRITNDGSALCTACHIQ